MRKTLYTEEQIAFAPRHAESDTPVSGVTRKIGITERTGYRRKKQFARKGVIEIRRLKKLVEDLTRDGTML